MFGSTNNIIKSQYNFETTTSTTPLHHNGNTTPTLNNLIGKKLIDTSLYSTDYSTTEEGSALVFFTPHSNLGDIKKNSCPQNQQISMCFQTTSKFAKAPHLQNLACSLREQPKGFQSKIGNHSTSLLRKATTLNSKFNHSPNVEANPVTFISSHNNTTATTEDLEDCFGSPTTPNSSPYHQPFSGNEVMTDSATPVSKLSTSTISKKSPLLTDDYSSQSSDKYQRKSNSSRSTKSSENLCDTPKSSWGKSKTCHSFKVNPYLDHRSETNYSCSYVRENNFMINHGHNNNNREKKAIFELSVNEDDLRILEEGIPNMNQNDNQATLWLNNIPPQFPTHKSNETCNNLIPKPTPFVIPQRDQGIFIKSQIKIDGSNDKNYNTGKPATIKDSSRLSIEIADNGQEDHANRLEKIHTDNCYPSHQNDTARCVPNNSTFEINNDGSRSCTSNSRQDFKGCMENEKFQPKKKHSTSGSTTSLVISPCVAENIGNSPLLIDDHTFLPSPILPKESSTQSNNTTLRIIDHSLSLEETKSIEKQALVKPDISFNKNNTEPIDNMLKAVSIRNELNHYPTQLQFVRMPVGGVRTKPREPLTDVVKFNKPKVTTPKKNIARQESRPMSELACSFKSNDGFFMDRHNAVMVPDNMDIDDCEEFEKNKQRFKNKFIKRRAKLFLKTDQVHVITSRTLSQNLKILTEKACLLQRLKLQLEEKTLCIQSVCDRIVHEDLSWQLEDIISESTTFWSCDQVTPTPSSVFQFLNRVCESENEIINVIEDLIDFVITSAKRMCKKHSLNVNIILDTIRESTAIELSSNRSYSQLKTKGMACHHRLSKPSISNISPISSLTLTSTSEFSLCSSKASTPKNVSNFDHNNTSDRLEEVFDIKKRNELFEIIENNVDTVLDICSAIRNYASDDKMETLDTVFEDKFSAYNKILDEMKNYSGIDFDLSIHSGNDDYSISYY